MGCFFGCFRVKDKERPRGLISAAAPLPKNREHLIANKRSQVGRFHNSQEIEGSSPFLEALSDCTELKKTENLCRRNGSINWAQKLVAPAEVPAVQEPEHSPHRQSAQLEAPVTPVSNLARERKFFEEDETGKFDDEVKYLNLVEHF